MNPVTGILGKIFSGSAGQLVEKVADAADRLITSKEEREQLKMEAQKIAQDHEARLIELANKAEEQAHQDRASARGREIDITKITGREDYMKWFLAVSAVGLLTYMIISLTKTEMPIRNEHILMLIVGELLGFVAGIYTYQFGTSAGSRIKDYLKENFFNKK